MKRERITIVCALVICIVALFNVPMALAFADQRFATQIKLTHPIPGYGANVEIDGNTAAVTGTGFRFSDFPEPVVFVYTREGTTWTLEQSLTANDDVPNPNNSFGFALALSGDTLVVGALGDVTNGIAAGAAYVYVREGHNWSLQQKLIPSDAAQFAQFGICVDITGDTIVVGANFDDDAGFGTGAVYVFRREGTTWIEEQKLKASDATLESSFGESVSISGQSIAVGSPSVSSPETVAAGAVYVFVNNGTGWQEQQKIKPNSEMTNQQFGFSVSISGDTIVATAPGEIIGQASQEAQNVRSKGAVYIFERSGTSWDHQKRFYERDTNRTGGFAIRAAIDGDTIIVGDPTYDTTARFAGAVFVFERSGNGWILKHTLTADDAQFLQVMGFSIAISGDTVMAGTSGQFNPGAAYIFQ